MPQERPLLFAHRGGRAHAAENTLEAFRGALGRGAHALESDVRLTADGVPVLVHGIRVGRWPRRRDVAATPRAELPAQVVSVPELYAALGSDFDLSLDVKAPTAFLPAAAAAQAVGAADRLWACGTLADVVRWREQDMGVRLVHSTRAARLGQQVEAHARLLAQRGVDALNLPRQDWTSNRVRAVQQAGVRAFGWDCHTIASAGQLLGWGCDGVYGDDVDVLLDAAARYAI